MPLTRVKGANFVCSHSGGATSMTPIMPVFMIEDVAVVDGLAENLSERHDDAN